MPCKVNLKLYEAAKNTITFTLYTKVDGVKTLRDIDWAVSGRFTVYDRGTKVAYIDVDGASVVITAVTSVVTVTILATDFADLDWTEGAIFRLTLSGSDGEPVVVAAGGACTEPFIDE